MTPRATWLANQRSGQSELMVGDNLAREMRRGIQFYCGEDSGEKRRVVENVQKRPEATRRDDDSDNS